jgi:hypothetical protein
MLTAEVLVGMMLTLKCMTNLYTNFETRETVAETRCVKVQMLPPPVSPYSKPFRHPGRVYPWVKPEPPKAAPGASDFKIPVATSSDLKAPQPKKVTKSKKKPKKKKRAKRGRRS